MIPNNGVGSSIRAWNDTPIARRDSDGYYNATQMAKANGKQWSHYFETERCSTYLEALSRNTEIRVSSLYAAKKGSGTWIHPRLAVDFARWISADFAVWMDGWFLEELESVQQSQPAQVPLLTPADKLETIRSAYDLLQGLGMVDERDKLNLADAVRDVVAELGGSKNLLPADEEMTISDAWMKVTGKRANRNALKEIGRFAAKSYRSEFGREPATRNQYVDGVVRSVKSYRRSWLVPLLEEHMDLFAN